MSLVPSVLKFFATRKLNKNIYLLYSSGSVVTKYRIGWEYKDDIESQDLIDAETLKTRLDAYLRDNNGYLYNYRIPVHSLRSECK